MPKEGRIGWPQLLVLDITVQGLVQRINEFSTWLYRIALNVGLSHARREREKPAMVGADQLDALGGGTPIHEPDERLALLARAVEGLAPLERALALLYLASCRMRRSPVCLAFLKPMWARASRA